MDLACFIQRLTSIERLAVLKRLYVHVPDHTGAFGPNLSPGESGITSDLGQRRGADVYYWEARTILRSQIRKESTHARETS